jgi:hypothetical protein
MATIVVGGSGRGVGKTALVCGLIAALPEFRWTAVKIAGHGHGKPEAIWEETAAGPETDTARYLAAGARRALLVTAPEAGLPLSQIEDALRPGENVIFESNRIVSQLSPDLCFGIVDGREAATKESFAPLLRRADALVVAAGSDLKLNELARGIPLFPLADMGSISPGMLAWVRARLSRSQTS